MSEAQLTAVQISVPNSELTFYMDAHVIFSMNIMLVTLTTI